MKQNEQMIEMVDNIRENVTDKLLPQQAKQHPKSILKTRKVRLNIPDENKINNHIHKHNSLNNNIKHDDKINDSNIQEIQDINNTNDTKDIQPVQPNQTSSIQKSNPNYKYNILGVGISSSTIYFIYAIIAIGVIYYAYDAYNNTKAQKQQTSIDDSKKT